MIRSIAQFLIACSLFALPAPAATHVSIAPILAPIRSSDFTVTINGHATPVVHAVSQYYFLSFDYDGPATVSVRASDPYYWDRGVEVQPMRYGIRPVRSGAVITFRIPGPQNGPVKLVIARPGDHFADSQMLFLFGNPPDESHVTAATPGIRYYGPGVHHENIDAHSGDRIYLAPWRGGLRRAESLEGARRPRLRPGHPRLQRPAESSRRYGLDPSPQLALHRHGPRPQHRDRWDYLHRAQPHLANPDDGFAPHRLLQRQCDRRQSQQRESGRHGLPRHARCHRPRLLPPRVGRRLRPHR